MLLINLLLAVFNMLPPFRLMVAGYCAASWLNGCHMSKQLASR